MCFCGLLLRIRGLGRLIQVLVILSVVLISTYEPHNFIVVSDYVWHKNVPLKISLFAWRLLRNRFPTRDNLFKRGIIPYYGCGNVGSIDHLCLSCNVTSSLWGLVCNWLGLNSVYSLRISDHFI